MNREILIKINELAENIKIDKFTDIADDIKQKLDEPQVFNIGIVSDVYGGAVFADLLSVFGIEESSYSDFVPETDTPYIINVQYSDKNNVFIVDKLIGDINYAYIAIKSDSEKFKNFSLSFICSNNFDNIDKRILYRFSYLFMLTNATMAMNLSEKTWIQDVVVPEFGCERMAVCLYNTKLLNNEEDITAVEKNISRIILNENWKCCSINAGRLAAKIDEVLEQKEELDEKRIKQILINGINVIKSFANQILQIKDVNINDLKTTIEKLETEKNNIEISSKIAVENKTDNLFTDLHYQIINAADNYFNDAYQSIYNRISVTDTVFDDIKLIPKYLENVCRVFEEKVSEKLIEEYTRMSEEFADIIENDCKKIIHMLKGAELQLLNLFNVAETTSDDFMFVDMFVSEYSKQADNNLQKAKTFSKGSLVASVALAFVNPVLGISALIGSRLYGSYKVKTNKTNIRNDVLDSLQKECHGLKNNVISHIKEELNSAQAVAGKNLEEIYKKIINMLIDVICSTIERVEESVKEYEKISELLSTVIPEIEKTL